MAGEWQHSRFLTTTYATHHRHSCIAARAGFGDLLIGAGALMCEANGLDPATKSNLREPMVELIKITEGFYARSEEHTSELQSLMRISYAVFCLKKKTKSRNIYSANINTRLNISI